MNGRRVLDLALATVGFVFALPVVAVAAVGIKLSSPGPVFYRARRAGRGGAPFTLLKLRTMHVAAPGGSVITAANDARVFRFGALLRATKVDELLQLLNVIRGDMAVVGPRPEDPLIVAEHYGDAERATLAVRPGLTSPGTVYYYAYGGEDQIDADDPVGSYLPVMRRKLAIDAAYARDATVLSDLGVIWLTVRVVIGRLFRIAPPARRWAGLAEGESGA